MVARLERIAAEADPLRSVLPQDGEPRFARVSQALAEAGDLPARIRLRVLLATEYLNFGRTEQAVAELQDLLQSLEGHAPPLSPATVAALHRQAAIAYLRQAEQDNCLAQHGPESCLLPLRGGGLHRLERGSRAAIAELLAAADLQPDDLSIRWLLNLAHMTLGEHPQGVPPAHLIPAEVFDSDGTLARFPNVAAEAGVDVRHLCGGVVMEDFDGDGFLDLMSSSWGLDDQLRLFRNLGNGRFEDRTDAAGLLGEVGGLNLVHADYDNDGDADVLVLRGAWAGESGAHPNSLLRNEGDGTFVDVTEAAGLLSFHPTQTAAWMDYDNDGLLDLFIGNESTADSRHPCELFRARGDGTFEEVAAAAGVAVVGFVKGVAWGDYDDDGLPDLYLSRMGQANLLFHNEGASAGGWRFTDATARAGVAEPLLSFATWFWDFDNDGRLDLLVLPFPGFGGDSLEGIAAGYLGLPSELERPRLYRGLGEGRFREVAAALGLDEPMLAMGANFGDLDNDGFPDFYVGTGEPSLGTLVPNRMYRNDGGRRFQDVTTAGGFGHLQKGHAIAFGDLDNDGDQDVFAVMGGAYPADEAHDALFENPGGGGRRLTLVFEGVRSNRSAIGARVVVALRSAAGLRRIHHRVGTGGSFGSSPLRQEIGLGDAHEIAGLVVTWPGSDEEQVLRGAQPDHAYRVREGEASLIPLDLPRRR